MLLMHSKLFFHVDYDASVRFLIYSFLYLQNSFFNFKIFINMLFETRIVNFTHFLSTFIHYLCDCKISEPYHIPIICSEFSKNFAIFETNSLSAKFETTKFNLKKLICTGWRWNDLYLRKMTQRIDSRCFQNPIINGSPVISWKRKKIEKTDNFKWAIWQCFPFLFAMSVTQVIGNCFSLDISDGEVCTVCTFLSKKEKVVKNSQKRQKWPKMHIFEGLA